METSNVILLVVTASISFAIGRTLMHFRKKRKANAALKARQTAAQALRNAPPGPPPMNKAKRKRQLKLR